MTAKELIEEIMRACGGNYERKVILKTEHHLHCPHCEEGSTIFDIVTATGVESNHPQTIQILCS